MTPIVTVFGSCRVHTPCSILGKAGRLTMNQKNIFGFAHYTSEILQQFQIIAGAKQVPDRLRPYVNIPPAWIAPEPGPLDHFHALFRDTDVFVVEISSVRRLLFKAFYLQINRSRELLAPEPEIIKQWWEPLVRIGKNDLTKFPADSTALQHEIASILVSTEQNVGDLTKDMQRIAEFLRKPVLFVSHFNIDRAGGMIPQRTKIVDAMKKLPKSPRYAVVDPTSEILATGVDEAIMDLGHYKPAFEPQIAERLAAELSDLISVSATAPAERLAS